MKLTSFRYRACFLMAYLSESSLSDIPEKASESLLSEVFLPKLFGPKVFDSKASALKRMLSLLTLVRIKV